MVINDSILKKFYKKIFFKKKVCFAETINESIH